jgi:hypothetical protein
MYFPYPHGLGPRDSHSRHAAAVVAGLLAFRVCNTTPCGKSNTTPCGKRALRQPGAKLQYLAN